MKANEFFTAVTVRALPALVVLLSTAPSQAQTCISNPSSGPDICVDWDRPSSPSHPNQFEVDFTDSSFPDVQLKAGDLAWRVWSEDAGNPGGIGDIGTITCPHADNFGVRIEDASGGQGARDVKGITLMPSSSSNHSNITVARISGDLQDDLTVVADSSGVGGEVDELHIGGDVTGDITIHKLNND